MSLEVASLDLQEAACILCGDENGATRFTDGPFRVVDCPSCGLAYLTPQMVAGDLADLYQSDYWESHKARDFGYTDYRGDVDLYVRTFRRRMRLVDRFFARPGRLLDVGCAAGAFLHVAGEAGWQTQGVEVSAPIAEFARERFGLDNITVGTLDDVDAPEDGYDLITMWDVIEHLPDPQAALRKVWEMLAPSGRLILETQNVTAPFARLMGRRWQHFKQPEHLIHLNPDTAARLLGDCGFEVIENTSALGGKTISVDFLMERASRVSRALGVCMQVLRPLRRVSFYANVFDEMVIVARPV